MILNLLSLVTLVILLCYVMYTDITERRISNNSNKSILAASLIFGYLNDNFSINLFLLIIIASFFIFLFVTPKFFGGGDAKLFIALIPFIGFDNFPYYMLATNIIGLIVAIYYYSKNVKEIPFGIAISLAAILIAILTNTTYLGSLL